MWKCGWPLFGGTRKGRLCFRFCFKNYAQTGRPNLFLHWAHKYLKSALVINVKLHFYTSSKPFLITTDNRWRHMHHCCAYCIRLIMFVVCSYGLITVNRRFSCFGNITAYVVTVSTAWILRFDKLTHTLHQYQRWEIDNISEQFSYSTRSVGFIISDIFRHK